MLNLLLRVAALTAIAFTPALAQQVAAPDLCASTTARPAFDVISIRPAPANSNFNMNRTADGLTATMPLKAILQYAYNLHGFQVTGGPDWLSSVAWKIDAKSDAPDPDPAKLDDAQRQAFWDKHMKELQSMLADRFHFQCHMETKELPVYELVVAKGGSKLKPSTAEAGKRGNTSLNGHAGSMQAHGAGVGADRIALLLGSSLDRLVLDKTGLDGSYDFALDWASDETAGPPTNSETPGEPSLFTAVEEQLGLRLQPTKAPVPVMVIDHVEQATEN